MLPHSMVRLKEMNDNDKNYSNNESDLIVDKVKGISLTPALTSLLKPSADYLAEELKEYLKEKIESLKKRKRSENISEHIKSVLEKVEKTEKAYKEPAASLEQIELFEEWVEGAQDIDPNQELLSSMWRDLLKGIIRGNIKGDLLISILKQLDSFDAMLLLKFKIHGRYRPINSEEKYYLKRLEASELVEEKIGHWLFMSFAIYIPLLYLAYRTAVDFKDAPNIGAIFQFLISLLPQFGILLAVCALIAGIIYRFIPNQCLSWLGEELVSHVMKEDVDNFQKKYCI
jgi:hypothetical protein